MWRNRNNRSLDQHIRGRPLHGSSPPRSCLRLVLRLFGHIWYTVTWPQPRDFGRSLMRLQQVWPATMLEKREAALSEHAAGFMPGVLTTVSN